MGSTRPDTWVSGNAEGVPTATLGRQIDQLHAGLDGVHNKPSPSISPWEICLFLPRYPASKVNRRILGIDSILNLFFIVHR